MKTGKAGLKRGKGGKKPDAKAMRMIKKNMKHAMVSKAGVIMPGMKGK